MENNDLISRAEAIDVIRSMTISLGGKEIFHPEAKKSVLGALDTLPAVDAEPVRHAGWYCNGRISKETPGRCTECGCYLSSIDDWDDAIPCNYCPNCGAKMDRGEENETD